MTVYWDSSAVVKLYADEADSPAVRLSSGSMVISALTISEVTAAFWGKVRHGEIGVELAAALDHEFVADVVSGRFLVIPITEAVTGQSLDAIRRHQLRGADALQLASAIVARAADPAVATVAVYDQQLRAAASAEDFALMPTVA